MPRLVQALTALVAASRMPISTKTTLVSLLGLSALVLVPEFAAADSHDYVYKQSFMPRDRRASCRERV